MINIDLESIFQKKSNHNNFAHIIIPTQIVPCELKIIKKNITKIWKKFISSKRDNFITLLENIGIQYKDLNNRKCCYCEEKIDFIDFFYLNSSLGIGKVLEIWQNNLILFYCNKCQLINDPF